MFVDIANIKIKAGDGGAGAVSFHREKFISAGGPDGGDGGKGGDVVFVVDTNVSTLVDFKYRKKYAAINGENGSSRKCSGKNAEDLIIRVPKGTIVKDAKSGRVMADLSTEQPVIVAKGGRGGWGNTHFATPTRQIPRYAKPGLSGETYEVVLELKLLADVGLVGFPNVGKSTLVSAVSEAKPIIANYHFTTLSPVLGVVKVEETSFVMADIPGLIEGASEGIGLGHQFLRHVDRCRLLVHIVDVSGIEGREPIEDFEIINHELKNFSEELSTRPMLVAGNKIDMATPDQISAFEKYITEKGYKYFSISAATKQGLQPLIYEIVNRLKELPPIKEYEVEPIPLEELLAINKQAFEITVENKVYYIEANWLEPILKTVNMEDYESLQYFQRVLRSSGIIDKLDEMGIKDGDSVNLQGFEFDYVH